MTTAAMLLAARFNTGTEALTIYDLAGLRHGVAFLCALPIILMSRPWGLSLNRHIFLAFFGGVPFIISIFAGLSYVPATHGSTAFSGSLPIMAVLVSWIWLRERPGAGQAIGIFLAVAGLVMVGWSGMANASTTKPFPWWGLLFFSLAALLISVWYGGIRTWQIPMGQTIVGLLTLNAVIYVPIWLLFLPSGLSTAPWSEILLQAVVHGLFGAFIAIFFHSYAARTMGPTRQAAMLSGGPALVTILAIPLLGEIPTMLAIAGVAVTTIGILMTIFLRSVSLPKAPTT